MRTVLGAYVAIVTAGAIFLWLSGPFEGGPRSRYLLFIVITLGAAALLAERIVADRHAAGLVRLAGAIGVTAIAITLYLTGL